LLGSDRPDVVETAAPQSNGGSPVEGGFSGFEIIVEELELARPGKAGGESRLSAMFARVFTYQGPPELIDEGIRIGKKQILPQARQLDGFKAVYFLVDRQSGKHLTITLWESEEAMRASEEAANRMRSEDAEAAGATAQSVERYEVVLSSTKLVAVRHLLEWVRRGPIFYTLGHFIMWKLAGGTPRRSWGVRTEGEHEKAGEEGS